MPKNSFQVNINSLQSYSFSCNRLRLKLIILFLLSSSIAFGQKPNELLIIQNVNVIPLQVNTVFTQKDIILKNGQIIQIRDHLEKDTVEYSLGEINGMDKYLIPSYCDAHIHLPEKENLEVFFLMNILNGVTTLRSMRGEEWHTEIDKTSEFTPRLFLSTPPITSKESIPPEKAKLLIANYKKAGFDFVKVLSVRDEATFINLSIACKERKMHLAGHWPSKINIDTLCKSDMFLSIEHLDGFFNFKEIEALNSVINKTISAGLYICPTIGWYFKEQNLFNDLRNREGIEYISKAKLNEWEKDIELYNNETPQAKILENAIKTKRQFDKCIDYLGCIYKQGGKLLLSPDASGIYSVPGFAIHDEMKHYANAGISNFDILKAACFNLSEMAGEQNNWGSIKLGAKSDMLLLNMNPLENIYNANSIEGIIFKGKYYMIDDLKKRLKSLLLSK